MLFRYLLYILILAVSILVGWKGYSSQQSDWSKTPLLDFATNKTVANYYGAECEWYRTTHFKRFYTLKDMFVPERIGKKLLTGDTLRIGFDYYTLMAFCLPITPPHIKKQNFSSGQVYYYEVYLQDSLIVWSEIK